MGQAVVITRTEHTADALRGHAAKSRDAAQVRRLLAMALILDGRPRTAAAERCGMDRQTLRDWVHRYNEAGLDGLHNQPNPGAPPRKLTAEQEAAVAAWVRQGPTLEQHKVVRWQLVDLRDEIDRRFGVQLHECGQTGGPAELLACVRASAPSGAGRRSPGGA